MLYFRFFFILFSMNSDKKCIIGQKTKLINCLSRDFFSIIKKLNVKCGINIL